MAVGANSRYRILRRLGTGGMGEVLLAEDTQLERRVALKVMSAELARDENQRKRFRAEAKAASALAHPHICVIHEVGETEDGRPFLAMEYVEGQTLDVIEQQRRLKLREIINIGIETAEALEAAHRCRLVHRDIKPSNIMLDARGRVKVLDFGLAKRVAQEELSANATTADALTRTGFLVGTPFYMSPEQVLGRELDGRSDIFSLGAVLYELVAGQRPFLGKTVGEIINNVVNQRPEPLGLENPLFSPALDRIIFKCLEKDPQQRYASAKLLAEDLIELKRQAERAAATSGELPPQTPAPVEPSPTPVPAREGAPASRPKPGRATLVFASAAVVLLLAGGLHWWLGRHKPGFSRLTSAGIASKSIAVLPFDNFSAERDTDYLSDGLTEEITAALSKVPGLKVASRNSAFMFKGKRVDPQQVGRALRVAVLLEGSLQKVGNQIHVSAQLINAADGFHLWSETYDRPAADIIAVQDDVAQRIAERLQGQTAPVKRQAIDPEAHKLYLQGRLFWNKRTAAGLKKAIDLFKSAIEQEPTYADAYAALASSYYLLPQYSVGLRHSEFRPLARAAADHALQLDPACAEAHAVLGMLLDFERDDQGSEEHFRRAIQADPNYATAHHWFGLCLELSNRREQALRELQRALDLDPLSPIIHSTIPEWYFLGKDYDRAIAETRKVIDMFPDFPAARSGLILPLIKLERYREALAEVDRARALQPDQPLALLGFRAYCLARLGQEADARKILAQFEQARSQGKFVDGDMCLVYQGLREYDKEFELGEQIRLTEGVERGFLCDPLVDELRELPQFQLFIQRAGLTNSPVP